MVDTRMQCTQSLLLYQTLQGIPSPQLPDAQKHIFFSLSVTKNFYHYLLTPWCRVLLEKLTGLQLVKKCPAFYGTRRFITALTSVYLLYYVRFIRCVIKYNKKAQSYFCDILWTRTSVTDVKVITRDTIKKVFILSLRYCIFRLGAFIRDHTSQHNRLLSIMKPINLKN